jgi:hypothetical protein
MPISRTVIGLIYYDECDSTSGYDWPTDHAVFGVDTSIKHSGTGSLYAHLSPGGYPIVAYGWKEVPTGYGDGRRIRLWNKTVISSSTPGFTPVTFYFWTYPPWWWSPFSEEFTAHDWTHYKGTINSWNVQGGMRMWLAYIRNTDSDDAGYNYCDHLVIAQSDNVIVTGLTPGQKVYLYRSSDNALIGSATCQAGQTSVSISLDAEDYPLQCYAKIYATNGTTLIETTSSYEICGGDTWNWTAGAGTLTMSSDVDIIYRQAASGTPKTANIIANLKTPAGAPYPDATIQFTVSLGSVSPTSDTTDANGNAHTALTATVHGLAVLMAQWLGDASVPACSAYYVVHVFYETEATDETKDYQFFVEGIEYSFVTGHYNQNEIGAPQDFEVEIPEWVSTITPNGLVNIYRLGILEFHGILTGIKRSLLSDRVLLKGPDVSALLDTRIVDLKIYSAKTADYIIDDLLDSFPCGIKPGTLAVDPTALTITIDTESLFKAIPRICDLIGWHYRVTLNRTLDFAESFTGGTTTASFTEGDGIVDADRDINYRPIANKIRMKGDGIYSTKQDGTKIQQRGIHEAPAFNKTISDQTTLDEACQALVDMRKTEEETIPLKAWDTYEPGTFGPEDYITVTSSRLGLSGLYQIRKITRDMTDAEYVELDLSNRSKAYWELDEEYRRMTKDANV